MKTLSVSVVLAALAVSGCASGPAMKINHTSKQDLAELSKKHFKTVGGGLGDYAKVVVPNYQLDVTTFYQAVGDHGIAGRLIGNKDAITMNVTVPTEELAPVLKEVTIASKARFKQKLQNFGFEVLDDTALRTQQEDVKKWYEKKIDPSPKKEDKVLFVGSDGVQDGYTTGCNFTRDIDAGCHTPRFQIALGAFAKEDGPGVLKAQHETIQMFFKPELRIDSGWTVNGKYESMGVGTRNTIVSDVALVGEGQQKFDNTAEKKHLAEAKLNAARILRGSNQFLSYSSVAKGFELRLNPEQLKGALMAELDRIEDQMIELYYRELN